MTRHPGLPSVVFSLTAVALLAGAIALTGAHQAPGAHAAAAGPTPNQPGTAPVRYSVASWEPETLGNYRAVLQVGQAADAVTAHVEWRRRDSSPGTKNLIVTDANGTRVTNVQTIRISAIDGDLVFAAAAPGTYYLYYLPNTGAGKANYPKVAYPDFQPTAAADWLARNHLAAAQLASNAWRQLPKADVVELQANGEMNVFWPMEVIASPEEANALIDAHRQPFLLFPEDRRNSIRMTDFLPLRWIEAGPSKPFRGEAMRGEFYAFQVGVFAARQPVDIASVTMTPVVEGTKDPITASFRCFNMSGTDAGGAPFTRTVHVEVAKVQALWCGVQVPETAAPGEYKTRVTVTATGLPQQVVNVTLAVSPTVIAAAGDDEPSRLSRLRWLDSALGMDDEIVRPYTPVQVAGRTLGILGRKVTLGESGFPDRIESYFAPEMTKLGTVARQVLAEPLALKVRGEEGLLPWKWAAPPQVSKSGPGTASWETRATSGSLRMTSRGKLEFDGTLDYVVTLTADRPHPVSDVWLEIPIARSVAKYMMGMGL